MLVCTNVLDYLFVLSHANASQLHIRMTVKRFFSARMCSDCSGPSLFQHLGHHAVVRPAVYARPHRHGEVSGSCDRAVSLVRGVLRAALLLCHPSAGFRTVSGRPSGSPRRPCPCGAPRHRRRHYQPPAVALFTQTSFLSALVGLPASVDSISRTLGPKNHSHDRMLLQMLPGRQRRRGSRADREEKVQYGDTREPGSGQRE